MRERELNVVPKTEACRVLLDAWLAWRGTHLLPHHDDIDPIGIGAILPQISILEVSTPDLMQFRLAGTGHRDIFGFELTGQNVLDITPPKLRGQRSHRLWAAATQPCGYHLEIRLTYSHGIADTFESLALPLEASTPEQPCMLIAAIESVVGRHWQNGPAPAIIDASADFFHFVDIGAGTPQSMEPPADEASP